MLKSSMGKNKTTPYNTGDPDGERIITCAELVGIIPLDRTTFWRLSQQGRFPKPIQLTPSRIGWRWSAVRAWLAEREANPVEARAYFPRKARKVPGAGE